MLCSVLKKKCFYSSIIFVFDFSFNNLFLCSFGAFVRVVVPLTTKPTDQKINEEKQSLSLHLFVFSFIHSFIHFSLFHFLPLRFLCSFCFHYLLVNCIDRSVCLFKICADSLLDPKVHIRFDNVNLNSKYLEYFSSQASALFLDIKDKGPWRMQFLQTPFTFLGFLFFSFIFLFHHGFKLPKLDYAEFSFCIFIYR